VRSKIFLIFFSNEHFIKSLVPNLFFLGGVHAEKRIVFEKQGEQN
jgi:hypothetical protein